MNYFVKIIVCIAMIVAMMSVVVSPAYATRLPTVIKPLETMAPAGSSGTTTGRLPGNRPIISLIPTTEPESNSSSAAPSRPLRGEENLIPTTEPTSGTTSSGTPNKPIRGEENLIPTTPSPTPSGTIQKPTTSGTTSSGTSTVQPTESATKPTEAAPMPTASISKSPYFTKHPTDENVKSGANAQFVAIAENADGYNWIILSADGKETYSIAEACSHFKGLKAEGSITTRLTLYYIPESLHGYYVACIAEGNGETVTSNGALVTIQGHKATAQAEETQSVTVPTTVDVTDPIAESTVETVEETALTEASVEIENTVPTSNEEPGKQEEKKPTGLYMVGGICIILLVVAIILTVILLKTIRKGKRR